MNTKKYTEVLTDEKIENIKSIIRQSRKDIYKHKEGIHETIVFGDYVDGMCLVYLLDNSEWTCPECFNEDVHEVSASYAIDSYGNFIHIEIGGHKCSGLELYKFDKENSFSLTKFELKRVYAKKSMERISTDSFHSWSTRDGFAMTKYVILRTEYEDGPFDFERLTSEDYDWSEAEYEISSEKRDYILQYDKHFGIGVLWQDENCVLTNVLINSHYFLLKDKNTTFEDDFIEDGELNAYLDTLLSKIFPSELFFNLTGPRYGVFDLKKRKTIIHCGEFKDLTTLINGFFRLDFVGEDIYTYDGFDVQGDGGGILYSSELSLPSDTFFINSTTGEEEYLPVNIIESPKGIYLSQREENGNCSGPLYIIREGEDAGRNVSWLKVMKLESLIRYVEIGYLHFNSMEEITGKLQGWDEFEAQTYGYVIGENRRRLWLANDKHYKFRPIDVFYMPLEVDGFSRKYFKHGTLSTYYGLWSFENLVEIDPNYLYFLIKKCRLKLDIYVISDLYRRHIGDQKYLDNLKIVESATIIERDYDDYEDDDPWGIGKNYYYDDNLDLDQQSLDFWNNF